MRKSATVSPWSTLEHGSTATLRHGAMPSLSEYSEIDGHNKIIVPLSEKNRKSSIEIISQPKEKITHIEQHITACENYIVQLTQIRADCEDSQAQNTSPKKSSRFKNSIKRNKRESSKHSSSSISSNITETTGIRLQFF